MRLRHKSWAEEVIEKNRSFAWLEEDLTEDKLFGFDLLEIGSGLGGFLSNLSELYPDKKILGVEVSYNAYASAVKKLSAKKHTNITIINAPIERLIPYIQSDAFEAIYINFPDPWPKKRQKHRRLSYPSLLKEYYRMLKKDGKIYFRTDNKDLYLDSIEYFKEASIFSYENISPFFSEKVDYLPTTEYETKFRAKGETINLIIGTKK